MQLSEGWCSLIGSLLASLIGSLLFAQLPLRVGTQRCRLFPRVNEGTGQLSALVVPASNLKSTDTLAFLLHTLILIVWPLLMAAADRSAGNSPVAAGSPSGEPKRGVVTVLAFLYPYTQVEYKEYIYFEYIYSLILILFTRYSTAMTVPVHIQLYCTSSTVGVRVVVDLAADLVAVDLGREWYAENWVRVDEESEDEEDERNDPMDC